MKTILSASVVFASLLSINAFAQNEAIPNWQDLFNEGGNVVGYANGGAGYAFTPTVSIAVTELGFGGSDLANYPYQVGLYDAGGNPLATAAVTTGSSFYNQTYYQVISPVDLTVGNTYYLGAAQVGGGPWVGDVSTVFTVNPDISYLASATGFGSGVPTAGIPGVFFIDANFQFTVVPEPSVLSLGIAGFLGIARLRWRKAAAH